jgi:hypothetical protein
MLPFRNKFLHAADQTVPSDLVNSSDDDSFGAGLGRTTIVQEYLFIPNFSLESV